MSSSVLCNLFHLLKHILFELKLFSPSFTQNVALSSNDLETLLGNPEDDESVWSFYRSVSWITVTDKRWW